ncbi:unnamed protein product [Cylindrotheca closterium]|uniref:Membrane-associated protein n=1 Tax=Cylindrotheca closterium TaxID=2856 RepID=A0AAD2FIL8_9STRA|nr:unnamed protein product [Cylindrotheca closterium]
MTESRGISMRTTLLLAIIALCCWSSEWFSVQATPLQQQQQRQRHQERRHLQDATVQGLQSHFGANSFAGGMVIPSTNPNVAYITGQVGAYNCFIGAVSLINSDKTLTFISKQILEGAICQTLSLNSKESQLLLLATAEEGGLFTETRQTGSTRATQYGLIAPLLFAADGAQAILQPGLLLHDDPVQYPKALVMDPFHDDFAYLVSMHSESKEENTHTTIDSEPNFTYLRKYGSSYFITIRRILFNDQKILPNRAWSREYAVTPQNSFEANVVVSNMIYSKGNLLLVGYTQGSGNAFGNDVGSGISGYVTKFDTETGNVQDTPARVSLGTSSTSFTLLYDVCNDNKDADFIYITAFTGEQEIVLIKMNAQLLEIAWQVPFTSDQDVHDLMCAVDETSGVVYMAGVVADGGTVTGTVTEGSTTTTSLGRNDVFVTQLSTDSGNVNWLRQMGTAMDDRVASIQILTSSTVGGGLLMFGDSSGSLMASASKSNEVWIAQIPMDGNLPTTTEISSQVSNDGGNVPIGQPVYDDGDQIIPPDDTPNFPNTPADGGDDTNGGGGGDAPVINNSSSDDGAYDDDMLRPYGISAIIVLILFAIGLGIVRRKQIQQDRVTERALVFSYLQAFEPEDIDVRNSATGGWHGTYVGKLHRDGAASHSSVVKDNTFVDYDLGSPVSPSREPRRQFVIGDDDGEDDMELDDQADDDEYRNRYKTDDDYENENDQREMDAVDIRIAGTSSGYEEEEEKPSWGKEIV